MKWEYMRYYIYGDAAEWVDVKAFGLLGWELVAIGQYGDMYFKRPLKTYEETESEGSES